MVVASTLSVIGISLLLFLVVSALARWARSAAAPSGSGANEIESNTAARHIYRSVITAFGFAAALLVAVSSLAVVLPELYGLPLALAPGIAMSGGLLLFASTAAPRTPRSVSAVTRASLESRHFWSFGGPRDFLPPLLISFSLIAFLLWAGPRSSVDEDGLYRTITIVSGDTTSISGPYPGCFYGGPLIGVTLLLLGSTVAALGRIATTPAPPRATADGDDGYWRRATTRVVSTMTTTALLAYFAGVTLMAGVATRSAATTSVVSGEAPAAPAITGAAIMLIGGALLALASLVLGLVAVNLSTTIVRQASAFPSISPIPEGLKNTTSSGRASRD